MPVVDPSALGRLALGGLLLGAFLLAVYDVWRVIRSCVGAWLGRVLLQVGDLLWGILCGCAVAVYLSAVCDGRFRWPFAVGLVIGALVWRLLPGRFVRAMTPVLAGLIRRLFWLLGRPAVRVGRGVMGLLSAIWRRVYGPIYTRGAMRRTLRKLSQAFSKFEMEG